MCFEVLCLLKLDVAEWEIFTVKIEVARCHCNVSVCLLKFIKKVTHQKTVGFIITASNRSYAPSNTFSPHLSLTFFSFYTEEIVKLHDRVLVANFILVDSTFTKIYINTVPLETNPASQLIVSPPQKNLQDGVCRSDSKRHIRFAWPIDLRFLLVAKKFEINCSEVSPFNRLVFFFVFLFLESR
jgi:hypothetical protein